MLTHAHCIQVLAAVFTVALMATTTGRASAASIAVEIACSSDYFAYCSKHDPDSAGAHTCMSMHGSQLSKRCVNALIKAGEVSKAEVDRRAGRTR